MAPLFIVVASFVLLRVIGWLGVEPLNSWRDSGRVALAIMFLFAGATHFSSMKHDYLAMIPPALPRGLWVIYLTGLLEIAGAIGLLIPRLERVAGICLILLLIAMFPANVNAALQNIPFRGESPTALAIRAPVQVFLIWMLWWSAIHAPQSRRPHRVPA